MSTSTTKRYSRKELDQLKAEVPMELVIEALGGEVHSYNAHGRWTAVTCPVHGDKHASAGISPDGMTFNCFGCGISGDIFAVIKGAKGISFQDAVKWVRKELVQE